MTTQPTISVVIPTYNRARLLASALETLCSQTLDRSQYEIIVVDNNSKDDTRSVTEAFIKRCPNLRYCFEPVQGVSHARNRGWQEAQGAYVGYVDDECRLPEHWVTVAAEIIRRFSPQVIAGPSFPAFEGPKPRWMNDSRGSLPLSDEGRFLQPNEYYKIVGNNMIFRRAVFGIIGGFDPRLGPVGTTPGYGEDTALVKEVSERFPDSLYYDPRLYVHHFVRSEKLTLSFNVRASFAAGRSLARRQQRAPASRWGQTLRQSIVVLARLTADLPRCLLLRDREQYPHPMNYFRSHTLGYVRRLGYLYEQSPLHTKREAEADSR